MNNLIVAVEGIDGSGKSTLLSAVANILRGQGIRVSENKLVTETISLMKAAIDKPAQIDGLYQEVISDTDRAAIYSVEAFVKLSMMRKEDENHIALFDRWFPIVEVETDNAIPWKVGDPISSLIKSAIGFPDLIFWLDIDPSLAVQRLVSRQDWMVQRFNQNELVVMLKELREKHACKWRNRSNVVSLDGSLPADMLANVVSTIILERAKF